MTSPSRFSRPFIAVFALLSVAAACAEKKPAKLAAAPPPATITEASIRGHMEFLASDAMQGRGSGSLDEWRTATYIGSEMRRWGIEPLGDNGDYVKIVDTGRLTAAAPPVLVAGSLVLTYGREMLVQSINKGAVSGPLFRYTPGAKVPDGR